MCNGLLRRLIGGARRDSALPLLRLSQGSYRQDVFPEDIGMTSATKTPAQIDLGFLLREPADVYHAKVKDFLSAHALNEFRRCPLLYRKKEMGLVPELDTAAEADTADAESRLRPHPAIEDFLLRLRRS